MNSLNSDEDLASKCIGLCHALASQNKSFSFSLTVGSNFSFSLDTRELVSDNQTKKAKKKKSSPSPSTIRRSAKRREQFLKKKQAQARPPARNPSPALVPGPRLLPSPPPEGRRRVMSLGRRDTSNVSFLNLDGLEGDLSPQASPPPPSPPPHPPEDEKVRECEREVHGDREMMNRVVRTQQSSGWQSTSMAAMASRICNVQPPTTFSTYMDQFGKR